MYMYFQYSLLRPTTLLFTYVRCNAFVHQHNVPSSSSSSLSSLTRRSLVRARASSSLSNIGINYNNKQTNIQTRRNSNLNKSNINMSSNTDEVEQAKEAAQKYESSEKDEAGPDTVFDKILSGEWSSEKVFEDDDCLAFKDINPQSPVHIVLIPKKRDGLVKISNARSDHKVILGHLMYVAQQIGKKECPEGFRLVINDGEHGAQSVYHLHIHIMGGRQMQWPPG